jgi:hypothetical protein
MTAVAHPPASGARLLRAAARGAVLVGAAIVVGIVLIAVVNGSSSPESSTRGHVTGTTHASVGSTTTTTSSRQVKVAVFNGSGVQGAATNTANRLRGLGYAIVTTGNAATNQTGTTVACKAGPSTQTDALVRNVGVPATPQPFPNPAPSTASAADCIVTVGK